MECATSKGSDQPVAYAQSHPSVCLSLEYYMTVKLLIEQYLNFKAKKEATQARLSLHLSKCHIVGNHISRLKIILRAIDAFF